MNNKSIRRNVTSTAPADQPKDTAWLRDVPRVPKAIGSGRKRKSRRVSIGLDWDDAEEAKSKGGFPLAWVILLGFIFTGLIIGAVLLSRPSADHRPSKLDRYAMAPQDQEQTASGPVPVGEEEALAIVRKALAVRDPAAVAEWIDPGAATTERVAEFFTALPATDGELKELKWMSSMDANGLPMEGVTVVFDKDGQPRNRLALLTPDDAGKWRMDYEAFARWSTPSWDEILGSHTGPALVRVFLGPDTYYNGAFTDDSQWSCFGMASPDVQQLMFGYCKAGSPQLTAIRRLLEEARGPIRMVLKIQRPEGGDPRQFEIAGVIAEDWVRGPVPLDER